MPSHLVVLFGLILLSVQLSLAKQLPNDLDSFLELLFDKSQCDEFLSDNDWVSVGTKSCPPLECDFPRQLCMRPAGKLNEQASNSCRNIPHDCLTAANDGVSLGTSPQQTTPLTPSPTLPPFTLPPTPPINPLSGLGTTGTKGASSVCDMDEPQGRFCGYQVKLTYNRHSGRCEQFFFPGCTTADTNANLFDSEEECITATSMCNRPMVVVPSPIPMPPLPRTPPPIPRQLTPDPSPTQPNPFPFYNLIKGIGGGTPPQSIGPPSPPSPNQALLGLITNGISQFTGAGQGFGGANTDGGFQLGGFNLAQIPDIIRSIQTASGKR